MKWEPRESSAKEQLHFELSMPYQQQSYAGSCQYAAQARAPQTTGTDRDMGVMQRWQNPFKGTD